MLVWLESHVPDSHKRDDPTFMKYESTGDWFYHDLDIVRHMKSSPLLQ